MTKTSDLSAVDLQGKRVAVVCARFYPELADWLLVGARRALADCNVAEDDLVIVDVPGCFELPLAAARLIESSGCDAVVALGAVVRGQTPHFDYVAAECARGIMSVQLKTCCPIGFGVLTTDTYAQAQERADPARGNKGYAAAMAAASLLKIPA